MKLRKLIFILPGFLTLALGTPGIFLPVLPTVPLYLLTMILFCQQFEASSRLVDANQAIQTVLITLSHRRRAYKESQNRLDRICISTAVDRRHTAAKQYRRAFDLCRGVRRIFSKYAGDCENDYYIQRRKGLSR